MTYRRVALVPCVAALVVACGRDPAPPPSTAASSATPTTSATPASAGGHGLATPGARAEVGKAAPDFALVDLDGKTVKLADHKGKTIVLEWFNPECPFVNRAHGKGSLVDAAKRATQAGVVWLAINSAAPGRQGHGAAVNVTGKQKFGLAHPILLDESGEVGRAYGATNTPHMFVIDDKGVLVYRGAIDNSPDGEGESAEGGKLVRYVDVALEELRAGKPVSVKETKAYGCSVKYAK